MPLRILCLHGMGVTSEMMRAQTGQRNSTIIPKHEVAEAYCQLHFARSCLLITTSDLSMAKGSVKLHQELLSTMPGHIDAGLILLQRRKWPMPTDGYILSFKRKVDLIR
jgi:hypothetical protein